MMANPQKENGFTSIANEILEKMFKVHLNGSQMRIVLVVWRYTYGFSRKEHGLSETFVANATGINRRNIRREMTALVERKIIEVKHEATPGRSRIIAFNKDYDRWLEKRVDSPPGGELTPAKEGELAPGSRGQTHPLRKKKKENIKEKIIDLFFESVWSLYPNKKGKSKISDRQKKKLFEQYGEGKIKMAVVRYLEEVKGRDPKFIQHGSTFFNGGFEDYLPQETPSIPVTAKKGQLIMLTDEELMSKNDELELLSRSKASENKIHFINDL